MKGSRLQSCCILEKEHTGELLSVWTFPSWKEDRLRQSIALLKEKRQYGQNAKGFFYFKTLNQWVYSQEKHDFIILLLTSEFNSFKYNELLDRLTNAYLLTYDPPAVLEIYLDVHEQKLPVSVGSVTSGESHTLKELVQLFGLDVIQIYNALLLKTRVIVYHHSLASLLEWLNVFPYLVSHRDLSDDIWPWIDLVSPDMKQIQGRKSFLAGCSDNAIFTRTDLFDLLVNLPAKELILARHAKDKLQVTKIHKEIAQELEKLANDESVTEDGLIQGLTDRTHALLDQIKSSIGQGGTLAIDEIKERYSWPASEFFGQLAESESIRIRK